MQNGQSLRKSTLLATMQGSLSLILEPLSVRDQIHFNGLDARRTMPDLPRAYIDKINGNADIRSYKCGDVEGRDKRTIA